MFVFPGAAFLYHVDDAGAAMRAVAGASVFFGVIMLVVSPTLAIIDFNSAGS